MHSLGEAPAMMGGHLHKEILPGLGHLAMDAAVIGIGLYITYKIGQNMLRSAKS